MEAKTLKVLMISMDPRIPVNGSTVNTRLKEYGKLVDEIHIVLLSDLKHKLLDKQIDKNIWVYPTNSINRFFRPMDALRIGKKLNGTMITTQDPFECGWVGMKLKQKLNIPLEVQLHTDPFSPYFDGFLNTIRKQIAKRVLMVADTIRVVTKSLGEEMVYKIGVDKSKINVLPIYMEARRLEVNNPSINLPLNLGWENVLLSVSRLAHEKNLGLMLKALKLIVRVIPKTGLVIVGSGPEDRRLKRIASKLDLEDHVAFAGWQEDLSSFYKSADILVQTSLYEGYGLSLIEAGLTGLPVVSTSVGVARELVDGRDLLIVKPNSEALARAIITLIKSPQKREELSRNIKKNIEAEVLTKEVYLVKLKENWVRTASIKFK